MLGQNHPNTLTSRHNIAYYIALLGDTREGLRLLQELLPDCERVLDKEDPETLKEAGTGLPIAQTLGNGQ